MVLNIVETVKTSKLFLRVLYKPVTYSFENGMPNPKIKCSQVSIAPCVPAGLHQKSTSFSKIFLYNI